MAVNDDLHDAIVRHQLFLNSYGDGLADKVVAMLDRADAEIVAKISAGLSTELKEKRLREMLAELRAINTNVYRKTQDLIRSELTSAATATAEYTSNAISASTGIKGGLPLPQKLATLATTSPIVAAPGEAHLLKSWTKHMSANKLRRVEDEIRQGMTQGETINQIVERLTGNTKKGKAGVLKISKDSAKTLVLTANATINARARYATFMANSGVIKSVQWSSTLDGRTSDICMSLDGQVWALGSDHPMPPAHPRCRSVLVPVTKSLKELGLKGKEVPKGTRASMDGQVPGSTRFKDFLDRQTPEFQDQILKSKARGDLYRSGTVSFDDLFRESGRFKSIAELRAALDLPPTPPVALAAPVASPTSFSPINPGVTDDTVEIGDRLALQKAMTKALQKEAADPRHFPRPEYKNSNPGNFGKASFSSAFDDRAVSLIAAISPELDAINDAFGVARLRGFKTITSKGVGASMGDAVMSVNPATFNRYAASLKRGDVAGDAAALQKEATAMAERLGRLTAVFKDVDDEMRAALKSGDLASFDRLAVQRKEMIEQFNRNRDDLIKKQAKLRALNGASDEKVASEWKPGDETSFRPFGSDRYFTSAVDKVRSILYHETAHNVHQLYKKTAPRQRYELFPLEQEIRELFNQKRFEKGWLDRQPTKYATSKDVEWFAESFSLYMMGRKDLVDDDLIKLIERVLREAAK